MSILNWLRDRFERTPTIKFKSFVGNFAVATPVVAAAKVKPAWLKKQGEKKLYSCPGMHDYLTAGYIITAHTDIHIKANMAGVVVRLRATPARMEDPTAFDFAFVDGMVAIEGAKKHAAKVPLPWSVVCKPGYSGYLLPALMHADYLDKLFVYPGVVDFDKFHTINFVFSPLKECEFVIYAGTPLLHVIPFKRETMTAECDKATERESDEHIFNYPSRFKQYYRKWLHSRKRYEMKCPYKHRG